MHLVTLVGSTRLSTDDVAAARDAVAALGARVGVIRWLEAERAVAFEADGGMQRQVRDTIESLLPGVDVFVRAADGPRWKLFVADMDSTMITVECIDELADYAGLKAEISTVTEAAMRGEIDFREALRRRVGLLQGLRASAIDACLRERVRPSPGARTLVRTLRANGVHTLLVSGGFTRFTNPVAADIGFDTAAANVLEITDGALTGRVLPPIVDAAAKAAALTTKAAELGALESATVAIGDGANDLLMIEAAGFGVAYHAKPKLAAAADARIRTGDLTALLHAAGIARDDWIEE